MLGVKKTFALHSLNLAGGTHPDIQGLACHFDPARTIPAIDATVAADAPGGAVLGSVDALDAASFLDPAPVVPLVRCAIRFVFYPVRSGSGLHPDIQSSYRRSMLAGPPTPLVSFQFCSIWSYETRVNLPRPRKVALRACHAAPAWLDAGKRLLNVPECPKMPENAYKCQ